MKRLLVAACIAAAAAACGSSASTPSPAPAVDAGVPDPDPDPRLSAADLAVLATLSPAELPAPPADPSNRVADDPRARALGQRLFFDALFAGALLEGDNDGSNEALGRVGEVGKVSCAGCHQPSASFADDRSLHGQLSLAARWTHRRTPSLLDVGQAKLLMWDGRKDSLFSQVFGPLESIDEMNSSRLFVAEQIYVRYGADYEALFGALPPLDDAARFPVITLATTGCKRQVADGANTFGDCHGMPGDRAEFDGMTAADRDAVTRVVVNMGKALGAYQRQLTCGAGRFDAWMHGDASALSRSEQRGAQLFVGKGQCATCHSGPFLSDQQFHNVGMKAVALDPTFRQFLILDDPGAAKGFEELLADPLNTAGPYSDGNDGRLPLQASDGRLGGHRAPTLRCVAQRPSFMHTGQLQTLEEVIDFFAKGGDAFGYPGKNELAPLALDARERKDLVAFLRALDGPGPSLELR